MAATPVLALIQPNTLQPHCVGDLSCVRYCPEGDAPIENHLHSHAD